MITSTPFAVLQSTITVDGTSMFRRDTRFEEKESSRAGSPLSAIVGTNTDRATPYLLLPRKYNDKISMARVGIRARPFEISAAFENFGNAREENPRILVNLLRFVGKKMVLLLIYPGSRTFKLLASSI